MAGGILVIAPETIGSLIVRCRRSERAHRERGPRNPAPASPRFLEEHSPVDDLVHFHAFGSREEQDNWVAGQIELNIRGEELRYDDIVVIDPNPVRVRNNMGEIRKLLLAGGDLQSALPWQSTCSPRRTSSPLSMKSV